MDIHQFETRKSEHIKLSLDAAHQASNLSGLDRIHLFHDALPEVNLSEVSIQAQILNRNSKTPFFVSGMTAGHEGAFELNYRIAKVCHRRGWAMGVGSQRRQLESLQMQKDSEIDRWGIICSDFPELSLFANIGMTQAIHSDSKSVRALAESIQASALVFHLNSLQEAIQPEGTPNFRGAVSVLKRLIEEIDVPIVLKETGCGFSVQALKKVQALRIYAIDVSGLGGTHWGRIEGARSRTSTLGSHIASTFSTWGESTVQSVLNVKEVCNQVKVWASGGVRTGLDAAKLIALGSDSVGFAQPVLKAALDGEEALDLWMEARETELKVALYCMGFSKLSELKGNREAWTHTMN